MARLMQGFPPDPAGQVTLANWRAAPFNRWGFQVTVRILDSEIHMETVRKLFEVAGTKAGLALTTGASGRVMPSSFSRFSIFDT